MKHVLSLVVASWFFIGLTGCQKSEQPLLTGRIIDARTGDGISEALVTTLPQPSVETRSGRDGYYVLEGLRPTDTILVRKDGYETARLFLLDSLKEERRIRWDFSLQPIPDTAYTLSGPVDASVFLESADLHRKKLSLNEARRIARELLPSVRFRKGMLVKVNREEEWLFEGLYGHNLVAVYINARSGEIRSVESEDPLLDRKLQLLLEERRSSDF